MSKYVLYAPLHLTILQYNNWSTHGKVETFHDKRISEFVTHNMPKIGHLSVVRGHSSSQESNWLKQFPMQKVA